jgi:hypothetical protein
MVSDRPRRSATSSPPAAGKAALEFEKAVALNAKSITIEAGPLPETVVDAAPETSTSLSPSPPPSAWVTLVGDGVKSRATGAPPSTAMLADTAEIETLPPASSRATFSSSRLIAPSKAWATSSSQSAEPTISKVSR